MSYYDEEPKIKTVPLYIGFFLLILSALGATFAANVTINGSNKIEFGQGIYVVQACNGWIQISLSYGESVEGSSPITGFVINSLDTRTCTSTNIQFKAFGAPEVGQLDLYDYFDPEDTGEADPIPVNLFTLRIDEQENVTLVDPQGTTISSDDPYISLDTDDGTRTYIVGFTYPRATVPQLTRITVESGPNV